MIKDEFTYKIIGCCMKVHSKMGNGFPEIIYQRCLAIEMKNALLNFKQEVKKTLFYEGYTVGSRRVDFLVEDKIIIEIKAIAKLEDCHLVQIKNYLGAFDFPLGLLVNFGSQSLQHKLIFNQKFKNRNT